MRSAPLPCLSRQAPHELDGLMKRLVLSPPPPPTLVRSELAADQVEQSGHA
jgi:hypothetical protein